MLFNSIHFAFFLPVVFFLYWFLLRNSLKAQNLLLLLSSYFFYACWDWRFLFLLIFSTLLDYFTGLRIAAASEKRQRQFWFWLSIVTNLGLLLSFKYFNFFAQSFADASALLGLKVNPYTLKLILPVGISFYTFHGLSYVIDIYNKKIKAEKNFIDYAVFVSFFPLLVAGPIERATHLLPQIQKNRFFAADTATAGLRQILWGLFKKVVIADQCALYADLVFDEPSNYQGSTLAFAAVLFAIEIYADFSGYSDIAIGTAKLFGIDLLRNFAFPYFSRDIAEFWRRWHISLSGWFRDYLYIPLGGSKCGTAKKIRNTLIIFLVSGLWHGANWTFLVWGLLNALYILPVILSGNQRNHLGTVAAGRTLPSLKELLQIGFTFLLSTFAWIFFRSDSISKAFVFITRLFSRSFYSLPEYQPISLCVLIIGFMGVEWLGRSGQFALAGISERFTAPLRWSFYYALVFLIFYFAGSLKQFIYFQF